METFGCKTDTVKLPELRQRERGSRTQHQAVGTAVRHQTSLRARELVSPEKTSHLPDRPAASGCSRVKLFGLNLHVIFTVNKL